MSRMVLSPVSRCRVKPAMWDSRSRAGTISPIRRPTRSSSQPSSSSAAGLAATIRLRSSPATTAVVAVRTCSVSQLGAGQVRADGELGREARPRRGRPAGDLVADLVADPPAQQAYLGLGRRREHLTLLGARDDVLEQQVQRGETLCVGGGDGQPDVRAACAACWSGRAVRERRRAAANASCAGPSGATSAPAGAVSQRASRCSRSSVSTCCRQASTSTTGTPSRRTSTGWSGASAAPCEVTGGSSCSVARRRSRTRPSCRRRRCPSRAGGPAG